MLYRFGWLSVCCMPCSMKIPLFDLNDKLISHKHRSDVARDEIYRVVALWLGNPRGEVLLAKRASTKRVAPGKWGPAVTGTVERGESYRAAMLREMREELGITDLEIVDDVKELVAMESTYFLQWYRAQLDQDAAEFIVRAEEVEDIRWFTQHEIDKMLKHTPDLFISAVERFSNGNFFVPPCSNLS